MSSDKGDKYERFVFECLKRELDEGNLPYIASKTKIIPKKKYRAKSGNEIEVDIAIEVYRDLSVKPNLIILVECKDYTKKVDTMRLNDLQSKVDLIGAHKGILVTSHGCQSGTIAQAAYNNISVLRLNFGDEHPIYELERSKSDPSSLYKSILHQNIWPERGCVGITDNMAYRSLSAFLFEGIFGQNSKSTIPFINRDRIENATCLLTDRLKINYDPKLLDFSLFEIITRLKYSVGCITEEGILGKCNFINRAIYLSDDLEIGSARWRFTFAHEIGHILLHRKIFLNDGLSDDNDSIFKGDFSTENHRRLEIQANYFASYLLMPRNLFIERYIRVYKRLGIPERIFPQLYVDDQQVNLKDYDDLLVHLSKMFGVSKQVIDIRLREYNLIVDERKARLDAFF